MHLSHTGFLHALFSQAAKVVAGSRVCSSTGHNRYSLTCTLQLLHPTDCTSKPRTHFWCAASCVGVSKAACAFRRAMRASVWACLRCSLAKCAEFCTACTRRYHRVHRCDKADGVLPQCGNKHDEGLHARLMVQLLAWHDKAVGEKPATVCRM